MHGQAAHAADHLGVHVEGLLGQRDGSRALLDDLVAPLAHLGVELVLRHHGVDQAHLERLLGGVAAAQVPDFTRLLLAHDTGQQGGAEAGVNRTDARTGLAELRVLRSDRQIANRDQHVAAADGKAIDARDHRLVAIADRALHFLDRQSDDTAAAVAAVLRALVAAGAERLVAGAGENDDADALVVVRVLEGNNQFLAGVGGEGVVGLGPVDGDGGNAIGLGVEQVREIQIGFHWVSF